MTRTAISKRLRFEVFKRDGFTCQYCGAHPPAAILHCDHIDPVSRGGETTINNLVTACQACNLGKSDVPLSSVPTSLADRAAEVLEREEQIAGYEAIMRARRERLEDDAQTVLDQFCETFARDSVPRRDFVSMKRFVERLGLDAVLSSIDIAYAKYPRSYRSAFLYFCGVCWNRIRAGESA